jgi:hypothetical protein
MIYFIQDVKPYLPGEAEENHGSSIQNSQLLGLMMSLMILVATID